MVAKEKGQKEGRKERGRKEREKEGGRTDRRKEGRKEGTVKTDGVNLTWEDDRKVKSASEAAEERCLWMKRADPWVAAGTQVGA